MLERIAAWRRPLNLTGFAICALLLAAAYFMQYVQGLEPCPLCIFQRVGVLILGLVFLAAALHHPRGRGAWGYSVAVAAAALGGGAVSARHVWLQSLPPDQVPACGPGLNYLLDTFPLTEALALVFRGSGECAEVDLLLGLSIPLWTLFAFIGLGLAGVLVNALGAGRGG